MTSGIIEDRCLVLDVDGTICQLRDDNTPYNELQPVEGVLAKLKAYKADGFHIILYTSRNMRTHGGNIGRINADTLKTLLAWLDRHDIPYDEVHVGKPWAGRRGFYVDDRAVRPSEFLNCSHDEILDLLARERDAVVSAQLPTLVIPTIIITMAGASRRFSDAGYSVPKYRIVARGQSLFSWSMSSLRSFIDAGSPFVFIAQRRDGAEDFIKSEARALGITDIAVVEIDGMTDGQATTAFRARSALQSDEQAIAIFNIDTHVRSEGLQVAAIRGHGWAPCFRTAGEKWSFARREADGRVLEMREKRRISDCATVGLYYFASFALFADAYAAVRELEGGERYVAPLYNKLIADGRSVYADLIGPDMVVPLGTPEDVMAFDPSVRPRSQS